jgi:shikimate 5-dehydrogenase
MSTGPDPDGSPLPDAAALDETVTVFDTVYDPVRTPLIREAEARGARTVTGRDMFVRQAGMQFELWTGREGTKGRSD